MNAANKIIAPQLAKAIAALCVRNTFLEDLHSGITPSSRTGDFSDVKVVTPYGEIPWPKLSRISDEEMKRLMKEIVNAIYTFLCRQEEAAFIEPFVQCGSSFAARWDEPELVEDLVVPVITSKNKSGARKRR